MKERDKQAESETLRLDNGQRHCSFFAIAPIKYIILLIFLLSGLAVIQAQKKSVNSDLKTLILWTGREGTSSFYTILYRDTKPDDIPQEVYDGLWKIQIEISFRNVFDM